MDKKIHDKYGKGLAIVAGNRSGLLNTYASYLAEIGYGTILLVANNAEKLEEQK